MRVLKLNDSLSVQQPSKESAKRSTKSAIRFEEIDVGQYKSLAKCTCKTEPVRMLAWFYLFQSSYYIDIGQTSLYDISRVPGQKVVCVFFTKKGF